MNKLPPPCPGNASSAPAASAAPRPRRRATPLRAATALLLGGLAAAASAQTAAALPDELVAEVQRLAGAAALQVWPVSATPPRVEVTVGRLDARLALAPCEQIVPFLPPATRPLGRLRFGLRCAKGAIAWRVTLPVEVKIWAPALVARSALAAGTVLQAQHLATAEVDLAARADAALTQGSEAVGRTLLRGLASGDALRSADLRLRLYFNAGDTVRVIAVGAGFAVSGEGQALGPGQEGKSTQVRIEGGRIVTGVATGERRVEVVL